MCHNYARNPFLWRVVPAFVPICDTTLDVVICIYHYILIIIAPFLEKGFTYGHRMINLFIDRGKSYFLLDYHQYFLIRKQIRKRKKTRNTRPKKFLDNRYYTLTFEVNHIF